MHTTATHVVLSKNIRLLPRLDVTMTSWWQRGGAGQICPPPRVLNGARPAGGGKGMPPFLSTNGADPRLRRENCHPNYDTTLSC